MSSDPGHDPASPGDTEADAVEAAMPDPGSDEQVADAEAPARVDSRRRGDAAPRPCPQLAAAVVAAPVVAASAGVARGSGGKGASGGKGSVGKTDTLGS